MKLEVATGEAELKAIRVVMDETRGDPSFVFDATDPRRKLPIACFEGPDAKANAALFMACHQRVTQLEAELTKMRAANHEAVLAGGEALRQLNDERAAHNALAITAAELRDELDRLKAAATARNWQRAD